jgi:hypothetical protein
VRIDEGPHHPGVDLLLLHQNLFVLVNLSAFAQFQSIQGALARQGFSSILVTNGCLALFAAWKAAGKPAEIHIYDQVGVGFGMSKRGLPVDSWTDRLHELLVARKITTR